MICYRDISVPIVECIDAIFGGINAAGVIDDHRAVDARIYSGGCAAEESRRYSGRLGINVGQDGSEINGGQVRNVDKRVGGCCGRLTRRLDPAAAGGDAVPFDVVTMILPVP